MKRQGCFRLHAAWIVGFAFVLLAGSPVAAQDCNNNGVPDDEEIANCTGAPACGDCNFNRIPDQCDITSATSQDGNLDGVPDECVTARFSGDWTNDIWGLPGGDYPDDIGHFAGARVTLPPGFNIFLDDSVQIRGLHLESSSQLRVTQVGVGDLTIVPPTTARLLNEGEVQVGGDRRIDVVGGEVTIGYGGRYIADPLAADPVSAVLNAGSLTLLPTFCGESVQMTLSSRMTVTTGSDLVLDGRGLAVVCPPGGGGTASVQGGKTPPILSVIPESGEVLGAVSSGGLPNVIRMSVGGSVRLLQTAAVCVGCTAQSTDPVQTVQIAGDFDNQLQRPSYFDWRRGGIAFVGPVGHTFEVGGQDVGATPAGFNVKVPTPIEPSPHSNFSVGTVRAEGQVVFANLHPNTIGLGLCTEALYVDRLDLAPGATVILDNTRVYYNTLIDGGADVQAIGCGALVAINQIPTVSEWGLLAMALLLAAAAATLLRRRQTVRA